MGDPRSRGRTDEKKLDLRQSSEAFLCILKLSGLFRMNTFFFTLQDWGNIDFKES